MGGVNLGVVGHHDAFRVDDDQLRLPETDGPLDVRADHGMRRAGIGTDDEDHIGIGNPGNVVGHRAGPEACRQTGDCGAVSQSGTVIDVIGAEIAPEILLEGVVLLVGGFRRAEPSDRIRACSALMAAKRSATT